MGRHGRTQIRTASGAAGNQLLERLRALRDDPTRALPECPDGDPPAIARLRKKLEAAKGASGLGFLAKLDKGVLGAIHDSLGLADRTAATHVVDINVAGARKFYLMGGNTKRTALMGVQNWDDPLALLVAYHEMARDGLWFWAGSKLWCTEEAMPPAAWLEDLADELDLPLQAEREDRWGGGVGDRILYTFGDGLQLALPPTRDALTKLRERVIGPDPNLVSVAVLRSDGGRLELDEKAAADHLAGRVDAAAIVQAALARFYKSAGGRFILGGHDYGSDQSAFLDALGVSDTLRAAVAKATETGHAGAGSLSDVLEAHRDRLGAACGTVLEDGERFAATHANAPALDVLRQAIEETERRQRVAQLPTVKPTGPVGRWLDAWCRFLLSDQKGAPARLRNEARHPPVPWPHFWALGKALGGDLSVQSLVPRDAQEAGESLAPAMKRVLEARGDAYRDALGAYLAESGSGEGV